MRTWRWTPENRKRLTPPVNGQPTTAAFAPARSIGARIARPVDFAASAPGRKNALSSVVLAAIDAARRARLANLDLHEAGHRPREGTPDPARQVLARRILESRNLVQVPMIELIVQRTEGVLELGEVHHPPGAFADRPVHGNANLKRVPVQARALVPLRHVRQAV